MDELEDVGLVLVLYLLVVDELCGADEGLVQREHQVQRLQSRPVKNIFFLLRLSLIIENCMKKQMQYSKMSDCPFMAPSIWTKDKQGRIKLPIPPHPLEIDWEGEE